MSQTQKQMVQLSLTTTVRQDDDVETFNFDTEGELLVKNDHVYLRYTENIAEQQTKVRFKFEPDSVRLHRTGDGQQTQLVFVLDQQVPAFYQTPAGQMHLATYTTQLQTAIDSEKAQGKIAIDYQLIANDQIVGEYALRLQFQAKFSKLN
ncbi:DUF1934 domain-containing protein [Leuconostoc lactis]|uniref:DUF1934 domain-containing protein n=1 Tax=Leuconostoc lactis TaxID=1246 RepID=UPI0024AE67BB|nr:DUF1934 domain-containing protein [Leuconostoc lactis]MDI6495188.1 DUF1934 domain-containing protein [Leuconostoc lactis]